MSSVSSRPAPVATAPIPDMPADADRLRQLDALRAELDRLDDALHDTLMRRAEVVAQVGALGAKGRVPLRPGREASILRRLLARNRGALAPATLVRIWREMLAGSSAQQNPMAIVTGDGGLDVAVREHFGALTRPEAMDPAAAIARVRQGGAALAVLPFPSETVRWWTELAEEGLAKKELGPRIHIVARLPFWAREGAVKALVLSAAAPDPSGDDRSLIVGEPGAGFEVVAIHPGGLMEVSGFVTQEDPRLLGMPASVLGAYAVPVGDFE